MNTIGYIDPSLPSEHDHYLIAAAWSFTGGSTTELEAATFSPANPLFAGLPSC